MTLPEVCPLDGSQKCKGRECHLFCVEWRTKEPTCLIGYSSTSKVSSGKASRKQDTYAEETFQKLNRKQQPSAPSRITRSEKGDWIPSNPMRPAPRPEEPARRKEEKAFKEPVRTASEDEYAGKAVRYQETNPEKPPASHWPEPDRNEAERASFRLEARLKREEVEKAERAAEAEKLRETENSVPKPRLQERVTSRNRNATIIEACDDSGEICAYPQGREESSRKSTELKQKRKKLDEVMDIELPDNYEEEFWS